jgi:hypothetical protein
MTTIDLETPRIVGGLIKLDIESLFMDISQLLKTAVVLIDDLTAEDANLPQNIITAAVEKLDKAEEFLKKLQWPAG